MTKQPGPPPQPALRSIIDEETIKSLKAIQGYLLWYCLIHGHVYRDVPGLGVVCVTCGEKP